MASIKDIIELVDKYWKFDENQQHLSYWHDKQDLLKKLEEFIAIEDNTVEYDIVDGECSECDRAVWNQNYRCELHSKGDCTLPYGVIYKLKQK